MLQKICKDEIKGSTAKQRCIKWKKHWDPGWQASSMPAETRNQFNKSECRRYMATNHGGPISTHLTYWLFFINTSCRRFMYTCDPNRDKHIFRSLQIICSPLWVFTFLYVMEGLSSGSCASFIVQSFINMHSKYSPECPLLLERLLVNSTLTVNTFFYSNYPQDTLLVTL